MAIDTTESVLPSSSIIGVSTKDGKSSMASISDFTSSGKRAITAPSSIIAVAMPIPSRDSQRNSSKSTMLSRLSSIRRQIASSTSSAVAPL